MTNYSIESAIGRLSPIRLLPALASSLVVFFLYWSLNQAESREIYASWDKVLHASVFFLIWYLARWSIKGSWVWIALLVALGGGLEELHQFFEAGHMPDLDDWYADLFGVALASALFLVGRWLWALHATLGEREVVAPSEVRPLAEASAHPLDWRWTFRLWRWEYYVVLLAGRERRTLTSLERNLALWSVWILMIGFGALSFVVAVTVLMLIQAALGW